MCPTTSIASARSCRASRRAADLIMVSGTVTMRQAPILTGVRADGRAQVGDGLRACADLASTHYTTLPASTHRAGGRLVPGCPPRPGRARLFMALQRKIRCRSRCPGPTRRTLASRTMVELLLLAREFPTFAASTSTCSTAATSDAQGLGRPPESCRVGEGFDLRGRGGRRLPDRHEVELPAEAEHEPLLCVNADEASPARQGPGDSRVRSAPVTRGHHHRVYAINCHTAYVYIRGEMEEGASVSTRRSPRHARRLPREDILGIGST